MSERKGDQGAPTPGETADESGAAPVKVDEKVQEEAAEERAENPGYD